MKRNYKSIFLPVFCVFLYILSSCSTGIDLSNIDDTSIKLDESLILPVAEANISVKDILTSIALPLSIDPTNNEIFFQWKYSDSLGFDPKINLVDTIKTYKNTISLSGSGKFLGSILKGTTDSITIDEELNLGINDNVADQRVDSIIVNSSTLGMNFDVSTNIKNQSQASDFKIKFIFDQNVLKVQNGRQLEIRPTIFTSINAPINVKDTIQLKSYKMYVNGASKIPYKIRIYATASPTSDLLIFANDYSEIGVGFKYVNLNVAYGRFNLTNNFEKFVPIPFKIQDYLPSGVLQFANPKVNVTAITNVGADISVRLDSLKLYRDATPSNKIWSWFGDPLNRTKDKTEIILGPTIFGKTNTQPLAQYDSKNGATDGMFSYPYPNMVNYKFSINSVHSLTTPREDFAAPNSKMKVDMSINVPLYVKAGSFYAIADTLRNINVGTILNNVDSAILILRVDNKIPFKGMLRMTFWKSDLPNDTVPAIGGLITHITPETTSPGNITSIYDIKSSKVYLGANTDSLGMAIDSLDINKKVVPQTQTIKIMLNKPQIEQLKQTSTIVLGVLLDTKSMVNGVEIPTPAHLTTNNGLSVKIGIFTKLSFSTNIGSSH